MGEDRLVSLIQRAKINPTLAAREDMAQGGSILHDILNGKQASFSVGKWKIADLSSPRVVDFVYGDRDAMYSFTVNDRGETIEMENVHRMANRGTGLVSFTELEHMAAAFATSVGKPVKFTFPLYEQEDTERFLLERGYTLSSQPPDVDDEDFDLEPIPTLERTFEPINVV